MSEISEFEIHKLTKEQNYIRGYQDCKTDMLKIFEDIKAEIADMDGDINGYYVHKDDVLAIIDKHIGKENK